MQSLILEAVTPEQPVVLDQNDAISCAKVGLLTDKLRTSATAFFVDVVFLYRLIRHPKTRWYTRGLLFLPVMYLCSPVQLIPNFIPVLGQMDDVFVIWITKKAARSLVDEKAWIECRSAAAATKVPFSKRTAVSQDKNETER
jgi:uncharacterized membrane protein YkvA (DUF1232 family)